MTGDHGFGLYLHWPFCQSKCPYCDFNSHVTATVDHDRWAAMLCREMETLAMRSGQAGRQLDSIFIGGGTPSLMAPAVMAAVLDRAQEIFTPAATIEITMEANPTSVEAARLEAFAEAGAGRLSMGIQALDDAALASLGRSHSSTEALEALATARRIFPRVSADFIYARPGQTTAAWQEELSRILDLGLDHLSLYQLTLEPGTAFHSRHKRGLLTIPDDDTSRALYDLTIQRTSAAGLPAYEVSNHAREGAACRHNLVYWRAGDWLGVGPGAYGRFWQDGQRRETRSRRDPAAWLDQVEAQGHALDQEGSDSPADAASEIIMMGLRLSEGVDLSRLESLPGADPGWINWQNLTRLEEEGLVLKDGEILQLSRKGRPLINAVLAAILA
ncbi:MAG: radical SAM family heme chaperone HemW [Candidatus Puniceispirillales bacterium]